MTGQWILHRVVILILVFGTTGKTGRAHGSGTVGPAPAQEKIDSVTARDQVAALTGDSAKWEADFRGMLAGWAAAGKSGDFMAMGGIRYIPQLTGTCLLNEAYSLDGELSVNAIGSATYPGNDSLYLDERLKPYRMWLRFSGDRFEVRAGLQKINFGSATLLRPLMWFDQIDPRDPLQLTDGVYGLLGRYYFLNNANIWVWGLYGNRHLKGWEFVPSNPKKAEYGGRVQIPVSETGELALSYHHRKADYSGSTLLLNNTGKSAVNENRIGFDGKFDLGAGFWFEGEELWQDISKAAGGQRLFLNLGTDYTFGLGNGLTLMAEHFVFSRSTDVKDQFDRTSFSALSVNYPINIFLSMNGIVFYSWNTDDLYNFVSCSLQFDRWSFYVMGFLNPENFSIYSNLEDASLFAGKGMQFMLVFNH